jgi:hypothetical protein
VRVRLYYKLCLAVVTCVSWLRELLCVMTAAATCDAETTRQWTACGIHSSYGL